MPTTTEVLTDLATGVWSDVFEWEAEHGPALPGGHIWHIRKRTLRGGASHGVDVIELNNGALRVEVLPTRGMGLWRGEFEGVPLGWRSPVAWPVHPAHVNAAERHGLGWLAGFNELLCRCGLAWSGPPGVDARTDAQGNRSETPLTLHGKIANTPAHRVEVAVEDEGAGLISVTGVCDEASLFGPNLRLTSRIETAPGTNRFRIVDENANRSAQPGEMQLLYHLNIGPPFLGAGSRFAAPLREVAPISPRAAEGIADWHTYAGPTTGYAEQVYCLRLIADANGRTLALLRNAAGDRGLSVHYAPGPLPCFTLWKNTQAEADGYCTGLEPATNYPNFKTFERERGRVVLLQPGETFRCGFEVAVWTNASDVAAVEREIAALQAAAAPVVHRAPHRDYSPSP
jgi:hypothetical protein